MTQVTNHDIAELVRQGLKRHGEEIGSAVLEVQEDLVREEDGSWYVPVRPSQAIRKRNQFYDVLNEIENELADERDIDVLIVPVASEED